MLGMEPVFPGEQAVAAEPGFPNCDNLGAQVFKLSQFARCLDPARVYCSARFAAFSSGFGDMAVFLPE